MTKYITALSGKGGASKSTLLYSVAKYFHDSGKRVVVLDYDANTSFTLQYERRRLACEDGLLTEMDFPEVRTMREPKSVITAQNQIIEIGKNYDYVIIDMAGDIGLLHEAIVRMSHLAIVPTLPEDKFVSLAIDSIELLLEIQAENEGFPISAVARLAFPRNGVIARMQNKTLEDYPMFDAYTTPYPAQYAMADKFGLAITELDRIGNKSERSKVENVVFQMKKLCKEIMKIVEEI